MNINPTKPPPHQVMGFDERKSFISCCLRHRTQPGEELKDLTARSQTAAGEFPKYEWVARYAITLEQFAHAAIAVTKMVNPNRGIGEDHRSLRVRRRGGRRSRRCVPPSRDSRRALS